MSITANLPEYAPGIFIQNTVEAAKDIILMPEAGLTTEERWQRETAWIIERLQFAPGLVIDYGCGIGRLAKVMDNWVFGIDISPTMRAQAVDYVQKAEFAVTHPFFLRRLVDHGLRATGAVAVWALQHCFELDEDCKLLFDALQPGSPFYTINGPRRYVPCTFDQGTHFAWIDDGKSVDEALHKVGFTFDRQERMPEDLVQKDCFLNVWLR